MATKVPAAQDAHVELEVAPAVVPYLPAGHGVHDWEPAVGLYDPASQFEQVALEVAPASDEYLPEGQLTHVDELEAPVEVEYLPAGQGVGSVAPARQ